MDCNYNTVTTKGVIWWFGDGIRPRARATRRRHGIGFETAFLIFNDPLALTVQDPYAGEEQLRTIGRIVNLIIVIHTVPEFEPETGEVVGRIISARKATKDERRAYEEGEF